MVCVLAAGLGAAGCFGLSVELTSLRHRVLLTNIADLLAQNERRRQAHGPLLGKQ